MAALTKIDAFEKLFKTKQAGLGAVNVCGSGGGSRRLVSCWLLIRRPSSAFDDDISAGEMSHSRRRAR